MSAERKEHAPSKLETLAKILHQAEIDFYQNNQNVGYRSLTDIVVFLITFALTEEKSAAVLQLAKMAKIEDEKQISQLREDLEELIQPESLKALIDNYEAFGGVFSLKMSLGGFATAAEAKQHIDKMLAAEELGFLSSHIKDIQVVANAEDAQFKISMANTFNFKWAGADKKHPAQYKANLKEKFEKTKIPYLRAETKKHSVQHKIVEFESKQYNVAEFPTLRNGCHSDSFYIIEPVNPADRNSHFLVANFPAILAAPVIVKPNTHCSAISFPELLSRFVTDELRLGIYGIFSDRWIAGGYFPQVSFESFKSINYQNGEKPAKGKAEAEASFAGSKPYRYIVSGPFLTVYSSGEEMQPYYIAHPRQNVICANKDAIQHAEVKAADIANRKTYGWYNALFQRAIRMLLRAAMQEEFGEQEHQKLLAKTAWEFYACLETIAVYYPRSDKDFLKTQLVKQFGENPGVQPVRFEKQPAILEKYYAITAGLSKLPVATPLAEKLMEHSLTNREEIVSQLSDVSKAHIIHDRARQLRQQLETLIADQLRKEQKCRTGFFKDMHKQKSNALTAVSKALKQNEALFAEVKNGEAPKLFSSEVIATAKAAHLLATWSLFKKGKDRTSKLLAGLEQLDQGLRNAVAPGQS